jgi:hypothetical protein
MPFTILKANSKRSFILQQGMDPPDDPEQESILYSALQSQPRLIGALIVSGVCLQSPGIFFAVGAALLCSAIEPRWNPFNALYNYTSGTKRGLFLLRSAQPRIFAEAMGGSLAVAIAILLAFEQTGPALLFEGLFLLANAAVVFSRFCFGAVLFAGLKSKCAPMAVRVLLERKK